MDACAPTFRDDCWVPPPERVAGYRVSAFMRSQGITSHHELFARAADEPEWFYPAALRFLGVEWMRPWDRLVDESDGVPFARWFVGGGTNVAWLAARRHVPSSIALIWEGDDGAVRVVTAAELEDMVSRAAAGLRALGVTKGDVVTMHLPMIPEAVVTLLASARIGALSAPAFSGYALDALAERIELGGARVVVTADGLLRRGKESPMLPTAMEACRLATDPPQLVVVPRLGTSRLPEGAVAWDSLLSHGHDGPYEVFDAETPWLLAFTSGSTGRPKGVVHTHGGMPYNAAIELGLEMDVREGDRMCWPSDMGWLTGPTTTVAPLILGATAVLFEGVADHPTPDRLWELVERHQVTHVGVPPTVARMLALAGDDWADRHELPTLRIIASTGEPWTLPAWRWLHRHVGRGRVPIINWAGGTEVGGGIIAGSPIVETPEGRFAGPALGKAADVVDEHGDPVVDGLGELVMRRSWPAMTRGFWQEPERYLETYWSKHPGLWVQGDRAIRHGDGTWSLPGRSDDVIKVAGKRIGPVEYESLAADVEGVVMAGVVGIAHPLKGEVPVLAVATVDGVDEAAVAAAVGERVQQALGKPMRPYAVVVVRELPVTRSGKIHRRAVRAWLSGADPGDLSSLENPACGDAIRAAGRAALPELTADVTVA
jgi:acetyl-CoA synthetase